MITPMWITALAAVALAALLVPIAMPSCRERGYPLEGSILIGAAAVALGLCAPASLGAWWIPALVALFITAMIPIGVDAWLDRPSGDEFVGDQAAGGDTGMDASVAALAASPAVHCAATTTLTTATIISIN